MKKEILWLSAFEGSKKPFFFKKEKSLGKQRKYWLRKYYARAYEIPFPHTFLFI